MAFVFHRRLAIPLWAIAFFAVALTAPPPAALSLIVLVGIGVITFTISGLIPFPSLRASSSVVQVLSTGTRPRRSAATILSTGACVRTLDEPDRSTADDALDLVRMADDGGWQMAQPPASGRQVPRSPGNRHVTAERP
jgi:hypothetical protein